MLICAEDECFQEKKNSGTVACASKTDILKIEGTEYVIGVQHRRKITLKDVCACVKWSADISQEHTEAGYSVVFKNDVAVVKKESTMLDFARLDAKGQVEQTQQNVL